jgi:hypothetical protein
MINIKVLKLKMLEIIKFWGPVKFKYKGVETLKMGAAGFKT